jgi:hypothetical protein
MSITLCSDEPAREALLNARKKDETLIEKAFLWKGRRSE